MSVTYTIERNEVRLVVTPDADYPLRVQDLRVSGLRTHNPLRSFKSPPSSMLLRLSAPLGSDGKPIGVLDPCRPENWLRESWWTGWAEDDQSWSIIFGLKAPQPAVTAVSAASAVPTASVVPAASAVPATPHVGFSQAKGFEAYSLSLPLERVTPVVEQIVADLRAR